MPNFVERLEFFFIFAALLSSQLNADKKKNICLTQVPVMIKSVEKVLPIFYYRNFTLREIDIKIVKDESKYSF